MHFLINIAIWSFSLYIVGVFFALIFMIVLILFKPMQKIANDLNHKKGIFNLVLNWPAILRRKISR